MFFFFFGGGGGGRLLSEFYGISVVGRAFETKVQLLRHHV